MLIRATLSHGEVPGRESLDDFRLEPDHLRSSRREQLRRWAQLTLEEIVRAQEEMAELSERQAYVRRQTRNPDLDT